MALGFTGAYGAAGAADSLKQLIERRVWEQMQRQAMEQAAQRIALQGRGLDLEARGQDLAQGRFDKQFGLDTESLNFRKQQYGDEAPMRQAGLAHVQAQTADLTRKPEAELAARAAQAERDKVLHGYRLGEIGAEGANQMRLLGARLAATGNKADAGAAYNEERQTRMRDMIDAMKPEVSRMTVGVGSLMAGVPESPARNFRAKIDALKSNIGFKELQEMRNASKTGGALGQVSDMENRLLSAALGSLDQGQSPEQFSATLDKIQGALDRWEAAKAQLGGKPMPSHQSSVGTTDPLGLFGK